jgi:hypothetical protein
MRGVWMGLVVLSLGGSANGWAERPAEEQQTESKRAELAKRSAAAPALVACVQALDAQGSRADKFPQEGTTTACSELKDGRGVNLAGRSIDRVLLEELSHIRDLDDDAPSGQELQDFIEGRSVDEDFVAELVPGFAFEDTPDGGSEGSTTAFIRWETEHFGFRGERRDFDFSVAGRLGFQPALTLVVPEDDAEETAEASAKFQEAFTWTFTPKLHLHFRDRAELDLSATAGQTVLTSDVSQRERNGVHELVIPANNGKGKAAWFGEAALGVKIYRRGTAVQHLQQGLDPRIEVSLGYRYDTRFDREGDLVTFASPESRFVFRFMLGDIRVVDRTGGEGAATFTLSFGVEHEWARRDGGVPAGTRFLLRGNLELLKALRRS